jgi:hypothetical protein
MTISITTNIKLPRNLAYLVASFLEAELLSGEDLPEIKKLRVDIDGATLVNWSDDWLGVACADQL